MKIAFLLSIALLCVQQSHAQTPIDRLVADCSAGPPQAHCAVDEEYPELGGYIAGRTEGEPPRGPNPFDWHFAGSEVPPTLNTTDVDDLYDLLGEIHQYLWDTYGRDGGNGHGGNGRTLSTRGYTDTAVHLEVFRDAFGDDIVGATAGFSNVTGVMGFATGSVVPDIVGHEYTHSILDSIVDNGTTFTPFVSQGESGAIIESYGDIFGQAFEKHILGTTDWLVSTTARPVRSLADPTSLLNSFGVTNPDRYLHQDYYSGNLDSGGIHINAGVFNKSAYLASDWVFQRAHDPRHWLR